MPDDDRRGVPGDRGFELFLGAGHRYGDVAVAVSGFECAGDPGPYDRMWRADQDMQRLPPARYSPFPSVTPLMRHSQAAGGDSIVRHRYVHGVRRWGAGERRCDGYVIHITQKSRAGRSNPGLVRRRMSETGTDTRRMVRRTHLTQSRRL